MHKASRAALGIAAMTTPARAQSAGSSLLAEKPDGRIAFALASSQPLAGRPGRAA